MKKRAIIIAAVLSDCHLGCQPDFHGRERLENTLLLLGKHSDLDVLAIQLPWDSSAMYFLPANAPKCPSEPRMLSEADGVETHRPRLQTLTSLHGASSALGSISLSHCVPLSSIRWLDLVSSVHICVSTCLAPPPGGHAQCPISAFLSCALISQVRASPS